MIAAMGKCLTCRKLLPEGAPSTARYCHTNCRSRAYRMRRSYQRQQAARGSEPPAPTAAPTEGARSRSRPPRADGATRTRPAPLRAGLDALRAELLHAIAASEHRLRARVSDAVPPPTMARQIQALAPESAVGYRLVLPPVALGDKPRYAPRRTQPGETPSWTLQPLQLPDDDRLRDGEVYRIVWLDAHGRRIPPDPAKGVDGLRYSLSLAPASEDPVTEEYAQALRAAGGQRYEGEVRKQYVAQKLRRARELEEEAVRAREAERQRQHAQQLHEQEAELRQMNAERAEVERRAQALMKAHLQAQRPAWHTWLPIGLALSPLLVQLGAYLGERRHAGAQGESADRPTDSPVLQALGQVVDRLPEVIDQAVKAAQGQAAPPGPPAAIAGSSAPRTDPPRAPIQPAQVQTLLAKQERMEALARELQALSLQPESPGQLQRMHAIQTEAMRLVEEVQALGLASTPTAPTASGMPAVNSSRPSVEEVLVEQLQARNRRLSQIQEYLKQARTAPSSADREERLTELQHEAKRLHEEMVVIQAILAAK